MNGTVFKRVLPSGTVQWCYNIDLGRDENGKRLRIFKGGFERKGQAEEARRIALNKKDDGELVKPDPTTFGEFLKTWFAEYAVRHCSPKSVERYHELAAYVLPHIGHVRLKDLTTLMLQRAFNEIKDHGGRHRKTKEARPLSPKTVRLVAGLVHSSLETAIEWNLLKFNPCTRRIAPKVPKREATALEPEQLDWYLEAARAYGMYEYLMIDAATGCRRGELLALTWSDVDTINRVMRISKSLEQTKAGLRVKSTKSEKPRVISLPASAATVLNVIRAAQEKCKALFGADYRSDLNLVFCSPHGDYLKPDSVSSKCSLIADKAGLKNVSLHTLRHSHGSLLLSAGVPLTTVSKRLGHSSPYVTATIYSHALDKDEVAAADAWDIAIQKPIERKKNDPPS